VPLELTVYPILKGTGGFSRPEIAPNGNECFKPYSKKFLEVAEGDVSKKSYKRLHRYRYSPTACYGNNEVHLHPWEPRRLTVREALRIQTVPDEYTLPEDKPLTIKYKMIGNGVPCELAHAVAKSIASYLEM
jgi:DNA (cytosine-5)-methyltransferase 1